MHLPKGFYLYFLLEENIFIYRLNASSDPARLYTNRPSRRSIDENAIETPEEFGISLLFSINILMRRNSFRTS